MKINKYYYLDRKVHVPTAQLRTIEVCYRVHTLSTCHCIWRLPNFNPLAILLQNIFIQHLWVLGVELLKLWGQYRFPKNQHWSNGRKKRKTTQIYTTEHHRYIVIYLRFFFAPYDDFPTIFTS
jgi:hypothetical protein